MKEKITELLKGKKGGKILFIIGIAAIICIFASSFFSKEEATEIAPADFSEQEYINTIEGKITEIVFGLSGDSAPIVTVTLETGIVYEYADETKRGSAADKDKTSEESEKTYITVKDKAGGEVPLIITSRMPQIRGVAVICGVVDEKTAEKIGEAIGAALDITSRQIYIGRKSQ